MRPKRLHTLAHESNTYFITTATWQRRGLFKSDRLAQLLLTTLNDYRDQHKFLLHEFVIMPDHIHLLLTPTGISIERAVQFIKGGFSCRARTISGNLEIWQAGFSDRRVRSTEEFAALREYVHTNPIKARLCGRTEDYPYSSAQRGFCLDPAPSVLKGKEDGVVRRG